MEHIDSYTYILLKSPLVHCFIETSKNDPIDYHFQKLNEYQIYNCVDFHSETNNPMLKLLQPTYTLELFIESCDKLHKTKYTDIEQLKNFAQVLDKLHILYLDEYDLFVQYLIFCDMITADFYFPDILINHINRKQFITNKSEHTLALNLNYDLLPVDLKLICDHHLIHGLSYEMVINLRTIGLFLPFLCYQTRHYTVGIIDDILFIDVSKQIITNHFTHNLIVLYNSSKEIYPQNIEFNCETAVILTHYIGSISIITKKLYWLCSLFKPSALKYEQLYIALDTVRYTQHYNPVSYESLRYTTKYSFVKFWNTIPNLIYDTVNSTAVDIPDLLMIPLNIYEVDLSMIRTRYIHNNFLNRLLIQKIKLPIGITKIGANFMMECESLTDIDLQNFNQVQKIGNSFMANCRSITKINLSPLYEVVSIGDNFLKDCIALTTVVWNGSTDLRKIGHNFLSNCILLTKVIFPISNHITHIGPNFLHNVRSIKIVNMEALIQLISLDNYAFNMCTNLTDVLLPLNNTITRIGDMFLSNMPFDKIDLTRLKIVKIIANAFLSNCKNLLSIDLSQLTELVHLGDDFMKNCTYLKTITLPYNHVLGTISSGFLNNCISLTTLSFENLINITTIEHKFLSGCYSLQSLDIVTFKNVTTIGDAFLENCTHLKSLDLSCLLNLNTIGKMFLFNCKNIKTIKFGQTNVIALNEGFLSGCESIEEMSLIGFNLVEHIGNNFMRQCYKLSKLKLPIFKKLKTIGDNFGTDCILLKEVDLRGAVNLEKIGNNFLYRCKSLKYVNLLDSNNVTVIGINFIKSCNKLWRFNLKINNQISKLL